MSIKILIAEDHDHTRQGLIYGLEKYENIEVVMEAVNGQEAVEIKPRHNINGYYDACFKRNKSDSKN